MTRQNMESYNKIINEIENVEEEGTVNIYCDEVDNEFDYDLTKMHNKNAASMDTIYSDGKIQLNNQGNGNCRLEVQNGTYVVIKTVKKDEEGKPIITNYSLIITRAVYGYLQAKALNDNKFDLYEKITGKYFKGSLENYIEQDDNKSVKITPQIANTKKIRR